MRRMSFLLLGLFALLVFLFVAGCSGDDDKGSTPNQPNAGDLEDPDFALVQQHVNSYIDSTLEIFALGLENIYQLPTDTDQVANQKGPIGPNDTVAYAYSDGWHITYVARHNDNFDDFFRDSVKFMSDSTVIEDPQGLDYMNYIRYWAFNSNLTSQTHTNLSGNLNIVFSDLDQNECSIDGFKNAIFVWNYVSADSTVEATFDMEVDIDNVVLRQTPGYGWINGCPVSGTYTMTIDESYELTTGLDSDFNVQQWQVSVSITDGVATIEVTKDNTLWSYTYDFCAPYGS